MTTLAGVILESEELHRLAYNAAFAHFDVVVGKLHEVMSMLDVAVSDFCFTAAMYVSDQTWT